MTARQRYDATRGRQARADAAAAAIETLLPDQDRARPDPVYQLAALRKG